MGRVVRSVHEGPPGSASGDGWPWAATARARIIISKGRRKGYHRRMLRKGKPMAGTRPGKVGVYELLQDYEVPEASVRVIRMTASGQAVERHLHHRSTQIYVALEGHAIVEREGVETRLAPYEVCVVSPDVAHGAYATGGTAIVMNISIPPLSADDQVLVPKIEATARWGD